MSVLTTLADGHYTLQLGGRAYRVRSIIDRQLQADFARWHYERVVAELMACRGMYTDAEFAIERDKVRANFSRGLYDFKSVRGADLLATVPGIEFMCSKLIEGVGQLDVFELLAQDTDGQVSELFNAIIRDSFPEAIKLAAKKKREAEAAAAKAAELEAMYAAAASCPPG